MKLVYNNIEIQDCRCSVLDVRPDYDPMSGIDYVLTRIRLVVSGVINPASTAYAVGPGFAPGTRAGLTLVNIRQALLEPRQWLQVFEGPDLIFASPFPNPLAAGIQPCDPRFGPLPHKGCSVAEGDFLGERTIIVSWGVDFWVPGSSNIVRSNRWTNTQRVNRNGMTTRIIRGHAIVRGDAIANGFLNSADDFRAALIVSLPQNFRRDSIECTASADGSELDYTVVDKEVGNSIHGPKSVNVFYMDGNATAGWDLSIKTYNDLVDKSWGWAKGLANVGGNPLGLVTAIGDQGVSFLTSIVPRWRGRCMVRVEAGRNVKRQTIAAFAAAICVDRAGANGIAFNPGDILTTPFITSFYLTQSLNSDDGQSCEARMEWMPSLQQLGGLIAGNIGAFKLMNLNNDYVNFTPAGDSWLNTGQNNNTPLPNSEGSRGTYVRAMAIQALTPPGGVPPTAQTDELLTEYLNTG